MRAANQPASMWTAALLCEALEEAFVEVLVEDDVLVVVSAGVDTAPVAAVVWPASGAVD